MSSKLSIQVIGLPNPNRLRDWILRVRHPGLVVKSLTHDSGFWREIKQEAPEVYLLGREYREQQPLGSNPEADAEAMARHILDNSTPHVYDGWEGYNEKDSYHADNLPRQCRMDRRLGQLMRAEGLDFWAMQFGVGHPGIWLEAENRWLWDKPEFLAMLREPGVTGIGYHSYYAPSLDDGRDRDEFGRSWWLFRPDLWWPSLPPECRKPIVFSECGIDSGAPHFDPGALGGWRSFTPPQGYMTQLAWYNYQLQQREYVQAATLFQWGSADPTWASFEVDPILDMLADHINDSLEPPVPPPPVPPDNEAVYEAIYQLREARGRIDDAMGLLEAAVEPPMPTPEPVVPDIPYWEAIITACDETGMEPVLLAGLMRAENPAFDPDRPGQSGERGLCQVGFDAWNEVMAESYEHAWEPRLNILAGARYWMKQWKRVQGPPYNQEDYLWGFVGYNAGPGAVARYIKEGRSLDTLPPQVMQNLDNYRSGIAWAKARLEG